ncbi:UbiA prenyltransferase family-domain-containing protein [Irpex rosettiformis]|uniref:UbiA prenyltransferase family-domain-containing protein n=1 Tax=Irpex rosettiformis TaxID=378272 RepID=A0ACB8UCM8_9APHY|nr:UbiA prenyltransferase family-domain-containing protein [Irpex rosettiformis]
MRSPYWSAISVPVAAAAKLPTNIQIPDVLVSISLAIVQYIHVLLLFTKSDVKTVLLPTTVFALVSSYPHISAPHILHSIFWTWLHLLQFCIANQLNSVSEDAINKPWRPLPSDLIPLATARYLRWTLLPLCFLLSLTHGTLGAACVLSVATYVHNDMEFGEHWLNRNLLCAVGYWAFNRGAASVASSGTSFSLVLYDGPNMLIAETVIPLIIGTTIHAQDFRDVEGDKLKGRTTLPILLPRGSRWSVFLLVLGWSVVLAGWASTVHLTLKIAYMALGVWVGSIFVLRERIEDDRWSYDAYNVRCLDS